MSKHTPGPWDYRTCYTHGEPVEYAVDCKHPEHSGPVATVHITVDNDEQDEDNARLIARAPDMHDILADALAWWHSNSRNFHRVEPSFITRARKIAGVREAAMAKNS